MDVQNQHLENLWHASWNGLVHFQCLHKRGLNARGYYLYSLFSSWASTDLKLQFQQFILRLLYRKHSACKRNYPIEKHFDEYLKNFNHMIKRHGCRRFVTLQGSKVSGTRAFCYFCAVKSKILPAQRSSELLKLLTL